MVKHVLYMLSLFMLSIAAMEMPSHADNQELSLHTLPTDIIIEIACVQASYEPMDVVAKTLRSLAHTHPLLYAQINSPQITQTLISILAKRRNQVPGCLYTLSPSVDAAICLRTAGAGQWLKDYGEEMSQALVLAITREQKKRALFLCKQSTPFIINNYTYQDLFPLIAACQVHDPAFLDMLFAAGAVVSNYCSSVGASWNKSAVIEAVKAGNSAAVEKLLERGIRIPWWYEDKSLFWYLKRAPANQAALFKLIYPRLSWKQWILYQLSDEWFVTCWSEFA